MQQGGAQLKNGGQKYTCEAWPQHGLQEDLRTLQRANAGAIVGGHQTQIRDGSEDSREENTDFVDGAVLAAQSNAYAMHDLQIGCGGQQNGQQQCLLGVATRGALR